MGAVTPYKAGGAHQHTPEMEQALSAAAGAPVTLSFTPAARADAARDPRHLHRPARRRRRRPATCARRCEQAYADEPFVHLLPEGTWPTTKATRRQQRGRAPGRRGRARRPRRRRRRRIDNLGKGAAGQAVQNANLVLGLPETTGLAVDGVAP